MGNKEDISTAIPASNPSQWHYPKDNSPRDLRIDFLRGLIMIIVITVHMEYYSVFSFFVWERVGVISSAEGFVTLSGIVLGMVHARIINRDGYGTSASKLVDRSVKLYQVNIFMIVSVVCLNLVPFIDAFAVMNFVAPGSGKVYPLFPPADAGIKPLIGRGLLLKIGPHQFQVIGLYVILLGISPLIFWVLTKNRTKLLMAISWIAYILTWIYPHRLTTAQFEYAFPLLTWQLIFIHGIIIGYHKNKILQYLEGNKGKVLLVISLILAVCFFIFTLNNPNPTLPDWAKLTWIDRGTFYQIHGDYFSKSKLGIGRIINNAALFVVCYSLLTYCWNPLNKALGWLVVPLGQASLYVFFLHVYFVLFFSLTPMHEMNNFWLNTLMHATTIFTIWFMVKKQVLFRIIPR